MLFVGLESIILQTLQIAYVDETETGAAVYFLSGEPLEITVEEKDLILERFLKIPSVIQFNNIYLNFLHVARAKREMIQNEKKKSESEDVLNIVFSSGFSVDFSGAHLEPLLEILEDFVVQSDDLAAKQAGDSAGH